MAKFRPINSLKLFWAKISLKIPQKWPNLVEFYWAILKISIFCQKIILKTSKNDQISEPATNFWTHCTFKLAESRLWFKDSACCFTPFASWSCSVNDLSLELVCSSWVLSLRSESAKRSLSDCNSFIELVSKGSEIVPSFFKVW